MVKWKERWGLATWGPLGILMFVSGFLSENAVTMVLGLAMAFWGTSAFLTYSIRSDHVVKRALEVGFAFLAVGVIGYGYIITRSLILGAIIMFIVVMLFIGFTLSFLLPRIHRKPTS